MKGNLNLSMEADLSTGPSPFKDTADINLTPTGKFMYNGIIFHFVDKRLCLAIKSIIHFGTYFLDHVINFMSNA